MSSRRCSTRPGGPWSWPRELAHAAGREARGNRAPPCAASRVSRGAAGKKRRMSTERWSAHAQEYRESEAHRAGADLDLIVEWAEGDTALDVATGGGHVARRLREVGFTVVTVDPAPGMQPDVISRAEHLPFADGSFDVV